MKMIPQSIRWRLPLSYAAIAFVATLALGIVLLTTLRNYYSQAEMNYLRNNAEAIGAVIARFASDPVFDEHIGEQLQTFAFLSQTRVQLLDEHKNILHDSGLPTDDFLTFDRRWRTKASIGDADVPPLDYMYNPNNAERQTWVYALQTTDESQPAPSNTGGTFSVAIFGAAADETQVIVEDRIHMATAGIGPLPEDQFLLFPARRTIFGFDLNNSESMRPVLYRSNQSIEMALPTNGALTGSIKLSQGPAYGSEIVDSVAQGWLIASVIAVVVAAIIGLYISQRLTAPLLSLTKATTQMTAGDLTARTAITSGDEVGTLAQSFNKMATRVEETIVTLRRFVADAAHELHTPLTALRTNLELLASEPSDLQRFAFAEQALAQVQRLEALTTDLLELSRLEAITSPAQKKPVNLTRMIQETSELYASQAEQLEIAFQLDMPHDDIIVTADETQIRHALCNLLENALKFTPSPGSIGAGITCNNSGHLEIWVQDTGIGIPDDDLPQLFSRFHRGRNAAAYPGSGLGLAIVKAITDAHNGSITAEPLPSGTRFTLRLPAA